MKKTLAISSAMLSALFVGCAPLGVYHPPETVQSQKFSRDMNGSYDATWSAVANAAGSSFFKIKNFDKGSGLMTLDYEEMHNNVGSYVTCGIMAGRGAPFRSVTPEANSVLNYIATEIHLSGTANITARPLSESQTNVQVNSQYVLTAFYTMDNKREMVGRWQFTSRQPDTQTVRVPFSGDTAVTCQPSFKLEGELLTEIEARLSTQQKAAPPATQGAAARTGKRKGK